MTSVLLGTLAGFKEFLMAPMGLWNMHMLILSSNRRHRVASSRPTPVHDQAYRRLQMKTASGSRQFDFTSKYLSTSGLCSDSSFYSSSESLKYTDTCLRAVADKSENKALPDGLLRLLGCIWFFNILLVCVMWLTFHLFSFISHSSFGIFLSSLWIFTVPYHLICIVLQNFIFIVMELVNCIYLKKISERITPIQIKRKYYQTPTWSPTNNHQRIASFRESAVSYSKSPAKNTFKKAQYPSIKPYGIGKPLMDRVYSILFFIIYRLQWKLISAIIPIYWINFTINTLSQAFLYACYAYEYYARQTSDVTIDILLPQVVNYWPVFIGYGLSLGVLVSIFPGIFGWGDVVIAFTYPILVVGSFQVLWSKLLNYTHRAPQMTRVALILSMRPALLLTNWILFIFGWFGLRFCLSSTTTRCFLGAQNS